MPGRPIAIALAALLWLAPGAWASARAAEPAPLAIVVAEKCEVTSQDLARLRTATFDQMDQRGDVEKSARKLFEAGCPATGAAVEADYLVHHPVGSDERRTMTFHIGQGLALAGQDRAAALTIAGAKWLLPPNVPPQLQAYADDWNAYVDGVYAFLVKDRPLLDSAHATLKARGADAALNASVLQRMLQCFDKPYAALEGRECRLAPAP